MQKEINYYWYHHMMPNKETEKISKSIKEHDFNKFIEFYKKWNSYGIANGKIINIDGDILFCPIIYLPSEASFLNETTNKIEYIDILNKDNFNKITYEECECG